MKKLLTALLAVIMIASCFAFSASAASSLKITAASSQAKAGENTTLTLTLSELPTGNVNLIHFKIKYDTAIFSLSGVKNKSVTPSASTLPSDMEITAIADGDTIEVYIINWNKIEGKGTSKFSASQKIEFTFVTKSGTDNKNYTFALSEVTYGLDAKILASDCISGSGVNATGTVEGTISFARGDLNRDGKKNTADAIYLLRNIFNSELYPLSQSGDMNGDGKKNTADAIHLLRNIFNPKDYPLADD